MKANADRGTLISKAADAIANSDALLVCAGAGMGVDSGLPDFRGNKGFWKAYPPFAKLGLSFIDLASPTWFDQDPKLAWGFYGHRLNLYRKTIPHKGFDLLLKWGESKPGGYFVFTSNVDGQFQKADFDESHILECHGSIHHLQCTRAGGCNTTIWRADKVTVTVDETMMKAKEPLPGCPICQELARPNILMFGDWSWLPYRTESQQSRFRQWLQENAKNRIAVVEIGAGTGVPTVRLTSESIASTYDATLIRINTREPNVPPRQISIPMGALEALEEINTSAAKGFVV